MRKSTENYSFYLIFPLGYNSHPNYGMIGQSEYTTPNNYSAYGAISAYQGGSNTNALGSTIGITTLANTINPYASSVIGSSNGYSKVLSIAGGGMASIPSCYSLSSAQHLQTDKNGAKDRLVQNCIMPRTFYSIEE